MHLHLTRFQVLDRQLFTLDGDQVIPAGMPTPPDPGETGWKDTVMVYPYQIVRIIARFDDYLGRFSYGTTMLEQADHNMVRQYETLPPCGDGGCPSDDAGGAPCDGGQCEGVSAPSTGCGCEIGDRPTAGPDALALLLLGAGLVGRGRPRRRRRAGGRGGARALAAACLLLIATSACSSDTTLAAHRDAQLDAPREAGSDALNDARMTPREDGGPDSGSDARIDASIDGLAGDARDAAGALPFGATCVSNSDCQTTLCFLFGDGTSHCTQPCTESSSCPAGLQGQKCNGKGYCAY
jgi:MYXO-CTERM domain-containing protein